MKKILFLCISALLLTGCNSAQHKLALKKNKDYVSWENPSLTFCTYTHSEGVKFNVPAFEVFIKTGNNSNLHMPIDSYAMGYGASCPMGDLGFYKPEKLADAEILSQTEEKMVIHLSYKPWIIYGEQIILDKQITILKDSPIMTVIDYYSGQFDLLNIAAGMTTAYNGSATKLDNGYKVEYFTGNENVPQGISSIIVMPGVEELSTNETFGTVLLKKAVTSNEPLRYYVGVSDKGADYLLDELNKIL